MLHKLAPALCRSSVAHASCRPHIRTFYSTPVAFDLGIAEAPPPTSFRVPTYSLKTGKETGEFVDLDPSIFGVPVRKDILHRAVVWKLACLRRGTAKTKRRGEMKGSKKKMFPQKGRGAARVGEKRSPIRRGGGKAHGKRPRDFSFTLPKKVRRLALRCALAAKFAQNKLRIISDSKLDESRTNPFARNLKTWGVQRPLIVEGESVGIKLYLAARNIPDVTVVPQNRASVYDILRHDLLLLNKETLPYLHLRVNGLLPKVLKKKGKYGLLAQQQREAEIAAADEEERDL